MGEGSAHAVGILRQNWQQASSVAIGPWPLPTLPPPWSWPSGPTSLPPRSMSTSLSQPHTSHAEEQSPPFPNRGSGTAI